MKKLLSLLLCMCMLLGISACKGEEPIDLWANATYTEDTELGEGAKTLYAEVVAEDKSVTFTVHTDKTTVGEALTEHNLISGENGAYGLYVKVVNGIEADYDKNQCYWGFNMDGQSMMAGVDKTEFSDGAQLEIIYTK